MTDSALPPLVQQMMEPTFYPHPVGRSETPGVLEANREYPEDFYPPTEAPIQLIQTHVSYVLLTGEYAYKLKKPVDFGFLDYTTLEKRQHFCQEELRLNQRAAPDIYLDVVPITQEGDRFALNGSGPIVDYAVKMRQFPQSTLLTNLFERGELTESLLLELARVIARFHLSAVTNDYIREFGAVERVRYDFDENFEQTQQYVGGPQTQQQFEETQAYCDRFFTEQKALFDTRIAQSWIRECHGDLHLRNIAFWNNTLLLFDCIEFNERFRFVDVMFDIAYIVMDLDVRRRPDLRTRFLNEYVEQTGDWEGLAVLPIYVNRQTYVRAKVTSFLLNDPGIPEADKQAAFDTAATYYKLAWDYTQSKSGRLIMMAGLSGSGKTTTARALAQRLEAIHIRSDAVRKHLAGVPLQERGSDAIYTPDMTQKTYQRLLDLGTMLAARGYMVILDAKYDRQAQRAAVLAQAKAHGLPLHMVHCTAPIDVLRDRLHHRTQDIADATADLLPQQSFEPFTNAEAPHVTTLDTHQPNDVKQAQLDTLIAALCTTTVSPQD